MAISSVQELLLASRNNTRAPLSPFLELMEGAAQGFGESQEKAPERMNIQLQIQARQVAMEQAKQDMARKAEAQKDMEARMRGQANSHAVGTMDKAAVKGAPVTPGAKIEYERNASGDLTEKIQYGGKNESSNGGISTELAYRMGRDAKKDANDLAELQIPGYALSGATRPTTKEAQDLRTSNAAMKSFSGGVDRLIELIKENGSTQMTGKGYAEMASTVSDLKLTLKDIKTLGVLSATDMALLEQQVFDPTSFKSLATSAPTAIAQLETTRNRARGLLGKTLAERGYSPFKSGGNAPTPAAIDGLSDEEQTEFAALEKRFGGGK